ncbi:2-amino-4-hydroxy-6-hydroxymethyldihydropteridine diphosphokinase [Chlorobaculum thiosulfatiphilum]|jgi:2-amino-4-hydroxy-6-hydroxymethyldihydropteridine diphosphokinase|uniref:2-amino-4-hydroxy-6-hydroxymethyldihydropteridine pyrophosphokinase n=1 Tax=Chlorobaculum thiosulfatiphilum TaxID=115852 RepID=A0A5C4S9S8_CHLTI|nr:2-amino-4-hydroxy-6-hydroxymethyldihydropteridine diphosphokinase [Chlorobaculum thiosulfatiphilum]TNJ39995.1 2-amino-4-hydroxy-6-hydroxymethyldihydropteridine diphosphokinase [Chlorobaculum thiosulfatiphilum]
MESVTAYIGIGSNVGDRFAWLQEAVDHLARLPATAVTGISGVYMTEPFGDPDQERYFNAVVEVQTSLDPAGLRTNCKAIEHELGRPDQYKRWSPRTIDLDILLYGDRCIESDLLVIPHAEMHRRKFVLVPLLDLANPIHPRLHRPIAELLKSCEDLSVPVRLLEQLKINRI